MQVPLSKRTAFASGRLDRKPNSIENASRPEHRQRHHCNRGVVLVTEQHAQKPGLNVRTFIYACAAGAVVAIIGLLTSSTVVWIVLAVWAVLLGVLWLICILRERQGGRGRAMH